MTDANPLGADPGGPALLDGHWQRVAALLLWKTHGRAKVTLTTDDEASLQRAFGAGGPVVYTHRHAHSLDFQLLDEAAAKRLAEHDATMKGSA